MECVVTNCMNTKKFKFPKENKLRIKWLEAIQQPDFQAKAWDGLCIKHFKPEDILSKSVSHGKDLL